MFPGAGGSTQTVLSTRQLNVDNQQLAVRVGRVPEVEFRFEKGLPRMYQPFKAGHPSRQG